MKDRTLSVDVALVKSLSGWGGKMVSRKSCTSCEIFSKKFWLKFEFVDVGGLFVEREVKTFTGGIYAGV